MKGRKIPDTVVVCGRAITICNSKQSNTRVFQWTSGICLIEVGLKDLRPRKNLRFRNKYEETVGLGTTTLNSGIEDRTSSVWQK